MKKSDSENTLQEVKCPACDGTGFPKVKQPVQPGRKIFPAPCKECAGKFVGVKMKIKHGK
jgi:DnaJ-class molecular chaperone